MPIIRKGPHPIVVLTQSELLEEARGRFGDDTEEYAFLCPNCADVATYREFILAGGRPSKFGQECIGRHLGALAVAAPINYRGRGCDWLSYGLFQGPWQVIMPPVGDLPQRAVWAFPLAGEPVPGGPVHRWMTTHWREHIEDRGSGVRPAVRQGGRQDA